MKIRGLRRVAGLSAAIMASASGLAVAQNYLLPNAPGKAAVVGACATCHAINPVAGHRRSPHQWTQVVDRMIGLGAKVSPDQRKTIIAYLSTSWSQPTDYIRPPQPPPPVRPAGPGLALALEAAQTAQETCHAHGYRTITLVVDSAGNTIVLLIGDGATLDLQPIAAAKTAVVLKYKTSSGTILNRMDTDPALIAEVKADPKMGEARQGGLPIRAGGKIIGAIATSGDFGPPDKDEVCAQAGLNKIASRLK